MNAEALKLEARLSAIEYMLGEAFRMVYLLGRVPQDEIEKSHARLGDYLQQMPMPTSDPAIADLIAGELQEAHERLRNIILVSARAAKT